MIQRHSEPRAVSAVALIGALAAYATVALRDIRVPGLYYDELIQVVPALELVRGGLASNAGGLASARIELAGHEFSLMTMAYLGALKTLVFAPMVAIAGITPESVRLTTVAIGAAALVGTFGFAKRLFGLGTAVLTVALLGTDPSFTYYTRVDYGPTALMLLLKAVALWLLVAWWQRRAWWMLALGSFALGLGVYDKVNFVWVVAAIAAGAVLVAPRQVWGRMSIAACAIAAVGFAIGAAPVIWFNATWPMPTLEAVGQQGGPPGEFFDQLAERLGVLEHLLDGGHLGQGLTVVTPTSGMLVWLFAIAAVVMPVQALLAWRGHAVPPRGSAFVLVACVLIVLAAAATLGGFAGHHLMLTYPFPHVLAAAMVIAVGRWLSRRAPVTGAAIVLMGALAAAQNCKIANDQLVALAATGGTNNFSDAIYDVARTLEMEDPTAPVVALDWGLHLPLVGLSQGTLRSVELLAPSPEQLQSYFADQRARFVAHAPGATNVQAGRSTFLAAVAAAGRQAVREHEFRTRDGQPVIEVYALAPATTEAAAPATSVASLTASPEQLVLSPGELGSTWLNWHVKDSVGAEVWVSAKGEPEHLFARAVKGAQEAPWISAPGTYTFRLYAGEDRSTLLGTVRVTAERRT